MLVEKVLYDSCPLFYCLFCHPQLLGSVQQGCLQRSAFAQVRGIDAGHARWKCSKERILFIETKLLKERSHIKQMIVRGLMLNYVGPAPYFANAMCVSSEAAVVMRVGLSMGGAEQPPPSNRLHAALH